MFIVPIFRECEKACQLIPFLSILGASCDHFMHALAYDALYYQKPKLNLLIS